MQLSDFLASTDTYVWQMPDNNVFFTAPICLKTTSILRCDWMRELIWTRLQNPCNTDTEAYRFNPDSGSTWAVHKKHTCNFFACAFPGSATAANQKHIVLFLIRHCSSSDIRSMFLCHVFLGSTTAAHQKHVVPGQSPRMHWRTPNPHSPFFIYL